MSENLFIRPKNESDLRTFTENVFQLLGVCNWTIRESSNYINGEYIRGESLGLYVKIALTDELDPVLSPYKFWFNLDKIERVKIQDSAFLEGVADLIARLLTLDGYGIVRDPDFERTGGVKLFYSRRKCSGDPRDDILIEERISEER